MGRAAGRLAMSAAWLGLVSGSFSLRKRLWPDSRDDVCVTDTARGLGSGQDGK